MSHAIISRRALSILLKFKYEIYFRIPIRRVLQNFFQIVLNKNLI